MDNLRAPLLGPVVGHTTWGSCRLWIRADTDQPKEDIGVFVLYEIAAEDAARLIRTGTFPLQKGWSTGRTLTEIPFSDTIGILDLDALQPATRYRVVMGTAAIDDPAKISAETNKAIDVTADSLRAIEGEQSSAYFTTFLEKQNKGYGKHVSFLVGSCHYPGHPFQKEKSVAAFKPVLDVVQMEKPDCLFMVGDQIYADAFGNATYQLDHLERMRERYTESWSGKWKRQVMANIPTYMILDDHEIEDNWDSRRATLDGKADVFKSGMQTYLTYQWSHGPRSREHDRGMVVADFPPLHYEFEINGFPFFVMDVRTERTLHTSDNSQSDLISEPQLVAFKQWLANHRGPGPKFVVSSVVFAPFAQSSDAEAKEQDGWQAYPRTRAAILKAIMNGEHPCQNVIFLCGDAHFSTLAHIVITSPGKPNAYAYCLASSAFFAPFTVARRCQADYALDSILDRSTFTWVDDEGNIAMDYRLMNAVETDNFAKVDVNWEPDAKRGVVRVKWYRGEKVSEETLLSVQA